MGSLKENIHYYKQYDWSEGGAEWSVPWGSTQSMWEISLFPRIAHFLPADRILEIGCGFGRLAKILHAFAREELVLVDIMDKCVEHCSHLFCDSERTSCIRTDGLTLNKVRDNSVDFIFSFYSLVGADKETLSSYMNEFKRVLTKNGVAFIHHSNAAMYCNPKRGLYSDQQISLLSTYRDITVDADTVRDLAVKNELTAIRQECINWDIEGALSDCFSTIVRTDSSMACSLKTKLNPNFIEERKFSKMRTMGYIGLTRALGI